MRSANRPTSFFSKFLLGVFFVFSIFALFFRKQAGIALIHILLTATSKLSHTPIEYTLNVNEERGVSIENLHIENASFLLDCPRTLVDLRFDTRKFQLFPFINFEGMQLMIKERNLEKLKTVKAPLSLLKFLFNKVLLKAENAELHFEKREEEPFFCTIEVNGAESEKLSFSLSQGKDEENASLLDFCVSLEDKHFVMDAEAHKAEIADILTLIRFFPFLEVKEDLEIKGLLDLKARASLTSIGEVEHFFLEGVTQEMQMKHGSNRFITKSSNVEVSWKRVESDLTEQKFLNPLLIAKAVSSGIDYIHNDKKLFQAGDLSLQLEGNQYKSQLQGFLINDQKIAIDSVGELNDTHSFFVQNACFIGKKEAPLFISYTQAAEEEAVVQMDTSGVQLESIQPIVDSCGLFKEAISGTLRGKAFAKIGKEGLEEIELEEGALTAFSFTYNDKDIIGDKVLFKGVLQKRSQGLVAKDLAVNLNSLNIWDNGKNKQLICDDLKSSFVIENGTVVFLDVKSTLLNKAASLHWEYLKKQQLAQIQCEFPFKALMFINPFYDFGIDENIKGEFSLSWDKAQYELKGIAKLSNTLFSLSAFFPSWQEGIEKGVCEISTDHLDCHVFEPFIQKYLPETSFKGQAAFKALYKAALLEINFIPKAYELNHPYFSVYAANQQMALPWDIHYNLKTKKWAGKAVIKEASALLTGCNTPIEHINLNINLDDERIVAQSIHIDSPVVQLKGFAEAVMGSDPIILMKCSELNFQFDSLDSFTFLLPYLPKAIKGSKGELRAQPSEAFAVFQKEQNNWIVDYGLKAEVELERLPLSELTFLKGVKGSIKIHKGENVYAFNEIIAELFYEDEKLFNLYIEDVSLQKEEPASINIKAAAFKGKNELAKISCSLEKGENLFYHLRPDAFLHILGKKLHIELFQVSPDFEIDEFVLSSSHKLTEIIPLVDLVSKSEEEGFKKLANSSPRTLVNWVMSYSRKNDILQFVANANEIIAQGKKYENLIFEAKYAKKGWTIVAEDEKGFEFKLDMHSFSQGFILDDVKVKTESLNVSAKGVFEPKHSLIALEVSHGYLSENFLKKHLGNEYSGSLLLKGSIKKQKERIDGLVALEGKIKKPSELTLYSEKAIPFFYSKEAGLVIASGTLGYIHNDGKKSQLQFANLLSTPTSFSIEECKHSFLKEDLLLLSKLGLIPLFVYETLQEEKLDGYLSVSKKGSDYVIKGMTQPSRCKIKDASIQTAKLRYEIDHKNFCLGSLVYYQDARLQLEMRIDFTQNKAGIIALKTLDSEETLKGYFQGFSEDMPYFKQIVGSLLGCKVELKRAKSSSFEGRLGIDVQKLMPLCSKEQKQNLQKLRMTGLLYFEGKFDLFAKDKGFQGTLSAVDFAIFGTLFDKLSSYLSIRNQEIQISDFKIADLAGEFNIKKATLYTQDKWKLYCPIVQISKWCPSAMRTLEQTSKELKPLFIHKATIRDLKGYLTALQTLQGEGDLYFSNAAKKESDFFDIPRNFIKNLGLDTSILTPVNGELKFLIKDQKCFLTDLINVKSEEGRSEFFLTRDIGSNFVDFDGNVFVDVFIKQNVMLKIVEPFTFSIRGTLKKPKYLVQ